VCNGFEQMTGCVQRRHAMLVAAANVRQQPNSVWSGVATPVLSVTSGTVCCVSFAFVTLQPLQYSVSTIMVANDLQSAHTQDPNPSAPCIEWLWSLRYL
jgi:hypothetical protein